MSVLLCFGFGGLLGIVFYGGLLWTVERVPMIHRPVLLVILSFLVRLAAVGVGFFLLLLKGVGCLAAGFLGLLLVRVVLTRGSLPGRPRGTRGPARHYGWGARFGA